MNVILTFKNRYDFTNFLNCENSRYVVMAKQSD